MTHDELLNNLNFVWSIDEPQLDKAEQLRQALRAVVELHKPMAPDLSGFIGCDGCSEGDNDYYQPEYPCETIQVIEKELQ